MAVAVRAAGETARFRCRGGGLRQGGGRWKWGVGRDRAGELARWRLISHRLGFRFGFRFFRQGVEHGLGGNVPGPFVLIGVAVNGFAFAALLLFADEAGIHGEREFDHGEVLGVQSDDPFYVAVMKADEAHDLLGLRAGEDGFGG